MRFKHLHGFQYCQAIPLVHLPTLPYQEISAQAFAFNIFPNYITYPKLSTQANQEKHEEECLFLLV